MDWGEKAYRAQAWILRRLHRGSYRRYYRDLMRLRAARDPRAAVGGMWDEIGRLQFEMLREHGLQPRHRLLDIGCGSLRGGVHFIGYLDPGHYTGLDISEHILEAGRRLLPATLLSTKRPHLLCNTDLKLEELAGAQFDFALAQSVFTHMPRQDIDECLASLPGIMRPNGRFFFTAFLAERERYEPGHENFYYPQHVLEGLCRHRGWAVELVEGFNHPRDQALFEARRQP